MSWFQLFSNNPVVLTQPTPGMESQSSTNVNIPSIKQVTESKQGKDPGDSIQERKMVRDSPGSVEERVHKHTEAFWKPERMLRVGTKDLEDKSLPGAGAALQRHKQAGAWEETAVKRRNTRNLNWLLSDTGKVVDNVARATADRLTEQCWVAVAVGGFGRGDGRLLGVGRHRGRDLLSYGRSGGGLPGEVVDQQGDCPGWLGHGGGS